MRPIKRKSSVRTTHSASGLLCKKENATGFVTCECFDTFTLEREHSSICDLFRRRTFLKHPPENSILGSVSKTENDSIRERNSDQIASFRFGSLHCLLHHLRDDLRFMLSLSHGRHDPQLVLIESVIRRVRIREGLLRVGLSRGHEIGAAIPRFDEHHLNTKGCQLHAHGIT